jgi:hypothetical protein
MLLKGLNEPQTIGINLSNMKMLCTDGLHDGIHTIDHLSSEERERGRESQSQLE